MIFLRLFAWELDRLAEVSSLVLKWLGFIAFSYDGYGDSKD